MADWRKLAMAMTLADGRIDSREVTILRQELFADGKIDKSELEFLAALRKHATGTVKSFDDLFVDGVKSFMLADGTVSDAEAKWLRAAILADGKVDEVEKRLLRELKGAAKTVGAEFEKLYAECVGA
jgi:uncharacterized tellurite resistance protein B-like protein